jgi:tripartite-type tricarboxylate transporter receptor subunit TctC
MIPAAFRRDILRAAVHVPAVDSSAVHLGGHKPSTVAIQLLLLLALVAPSCAQAQNAAETWPARPVRVVVPGQAGGAGDIVTRIVAQRLSERLKQQFVIDNRTGAGGIIGADAIARAAPDGYTIGLITASTHASAAALTPNLSYDPVKDFAPLSMIGVSPYVMAVYPGVAADNVAALIALAKARPHPLNNASFGPSSLAYLAAALFSTLSGITFNQVPYRSSAQAVLDLVEGRIDVQFGTVPPTLPLIHSGKVRALAVTGGTRSASLPDVPTIAESGLAGYQAVLWQALAAPAGTPEQVVVKINREMNAILAEPATVALLDQQGVEAEPTTPEALGARIRADIDKWRGVVAKAGIKP